MDTLTLLDIWVMGALGLGFPLNIGYLICAYMQAARSHPQQSLPYGCLITDILHNFSVPLDINEPLIQLSPRQHITISSFKAKLWEKVDGIWQMKPKSNTGAASSSKRPRTESQEAPEEGTSTSRSRTDEKLDLLSASVESLATSVQSLRTFVEENFRVQNARLERMEQKMDSFAGDL